MTLDESLTKWAAVRDIGRKASTVHYHAEILSAIRCHWPDTSQETSTVTSGDVQTFALAIGHFSATRFNAMVNALNAVLPRLGIVKRRPAVGIIRLRPITLRERENISQAQFDTLLEEADKLPRSKAGLVIDFLAHTGMRITEARKLRWRDVRTNFILVPGSITKNGRVKAIPFVNGFRAVLRRLRRLTGKTEFVLPDGSVRKGITIACDRAGVPRLTHHDFRHLFTTRCIESGVDVPTVARWRGDSDGGAMLVRVYFHLADVHSRRMARRVQI